MSTPIAPFTLAEMVIPFSRRVLLHSDSPSTGKTYLSTRGGLRKGQKVFSYQAQPEQSASELIGQWTLKGREMVWVNGLGIQAWLQGARLVIDEIDRASADVLTFLYKLLDDPEFAQYKLPDGKTVRPAEGFQVIATMNGRPEDLPEAIRSRFPVTIECTEPNPVAIQALPEDLRDIARNTACHTDPDRRITLRVWFAYAQLRNDVGKEAAAQACFQHRAQEILDALAIASPTPVASESDDYESEDDSDDTSDETPEGYGKPGYDPDADCNCVYCRNERLEAEKVEAEDA